MPLKQCDYQGNYVDTIYTQAELNAAVKKLEDALEEIKQKYLHGCMPADAMYQIAEKALKGE